MIGLNRRRTMGNVTSAFPSGYTRLQYVDNQGAAYCSTNILVSGDMTFDFDICVVQNYSNAHNTVLGGGLNHTQTRDSVGFVIASGNLLRPIYKMGSTTSVGIDKGNWHNISLKEDGFYRDDNIILSITRSAFSTTTKFYIGSYSFFLSYAAYLHLGAGNINGVAFIPAKRDSDDAVGFLRMSDEVFLTSNSNTPFLAGPNY